LGGPKLDGVDPDGYTIDFGCWGSRRQSFAERLSCPVWRGDSTFHLDLSFEVRGASLTPRQGYQASALTPEEQEALGAEQSQLFERACTGGDSSSCFVAGAVAYNDDIKPADPVAAKSWFRAGCALDPNGRCPGFTRRLSAATRSRLQRGVDAGKAAVHVRARGGNDQAFQVGALEVSCGRRRDAAAQAPVSANGSATT
jgi:hypothetical protein